MAQKQQDAGNTNGSTTQLQGFHVDSIDASELSVTITMGVGAASIVNWALRQAARDRNCNNPGLATAIAERLNTSRLHFFHGSPLVDQNGKAICEFYTSSEGKEMSGAAAARLQNTKAAEAKAAEAVA